MTEWIGQQLGKVHIEKLIARGGMAEVYYGTHTTLNRPVAVKVMLSHLEEQPELRTRFEREARVLAGLRHPNLVQIYDFDVVNGQPYIVMEYIGGPTLAAYLRVMHTNGGRMTLIQIGRMLVMIAAALDYAHNKGVVHRDVKPANVILTSKTVTPVLGQPLPEDAEPVLTDFGLLLLTDGSARSISGTVAGTPAYMSPEQARGDRVGYRSDLYSLGVILYEMLSGRVPFEADTSMGVLMKHIQEEPPPVPDLPAPLDSVLNRMLAKRPEDRFSSARDLLKAFLEASHLTVSDVAPGYSITPQPGQIPPAPIPERSTLAPKPTPIPTSNRTQASIARVRQAPKKGVSTWMILVPLLLAGIGGFCLLGGVGTAWVFRGSLFPGLAAAPVTTPPINGTQVPGSATETPHIHESSTQTSVQAPVETPTFGRIRFYDVNSFLDEVILTISGMKPAPEGFQYEAWLTGGEVRRSLGVLKLDNEGNDEISFVDDQGRNLLARYDRMEITLEPVPDPSPNPSGQVIFSSGIPPQALTHIKHLLVEFDGTPNNTGMLIGLVQDSTLLNNLANTMLDAYEKQDATAVRQNAEAIYNVLVGKQGEGYGDLDGDGTVVDPSDGFGLLLNGEQEGYIGGAISHAEFAVSMVDADEAIHHHTPHITTSAKNVEGWASELRDLVKQIIADPLGPDANSHIRDATALADRILNGRDLNGNEIVDPIEGEGGAKTALEHATYMIDMPIMEGKDMLPPPVAVDSSVTPAPAPGYGP